MIEKMADDLIGQMTEAIHARVTVVPDVGLIGQN